MIVFDAALPDFLRIFYLKRFDFSPRYGSKCPAFQKPCRPLPSPRTGLPLEVLLRWVIDLKHLFKIPVVHDAVRNADNYLKQAQDGVLQISIPYSDAPGKQHEKILNKIH